MLGLEFNSSLTVRKVARQRGAQLQPKPTAQSQPKSAAKPQPKTAAQGKGMPSVQYLQKAIQTQAEEKALVEAMARILAQVSAKEAKN